MREFQHRVQGLFLPFNRDYNRVTPLTQSVPVRDEMPDSICYTLSF